MISSVPLGGSLAAPRPAPSASMSGCRAHRRDPRWSRIVDGLYALRSKGRHAVRIVDADCAAGGLLLEALGYARQLGFTAVEGRGIDGSPALIGRARAAAARSPDLAIGAVFDLADMAIALEEECEFPADVIIWPGSRRGDVSAVVDLLHRAGNLVVGDDDRERSSATVQ